MKRAFLRLLLRLSFAVVAAVVSAFPCSPALADESDKTNHAMVPSVDSRMSLDDYLTVVGARLNCYFTLELDSRRQPQVFGEKASFKLSPLLVASTKEDGSTITIHALIKKLQRELPEVHIAQSKEDPRIIHLIDASLLADADYSIQKRASITYSGLLYQFPDAIGKSVAGLTSRQWLMVPVFNFDWATTVHVRASQGTVRELLTQAVPLAGYKHIIWVAETFAKQGKAETQVQFYGPLKKAKAEIR